MPPWRYFGCNEDGTPKRLIKRDFDFIGHRKIFYSISVCVIVAGLVFGVVKGFNYGIDFTGGTMMQIDMGQTVSTEEVTETLRDFDLNPSIVLAGEKKDQIILKTIKALESDERAEIVSKLGEKYGITESSVLSSEQFGPTVGNELKANAVKSILIAAACMLIYIILRFKSWKYCFRPCRRASQSPLPA